MEIYWRIFGIIWIIFNFKFINVIYEILKHMQKLPLKPLFKFNIILLKWSYLCIAALIPPACFGFLNLHVRDIFIILWITLSLFVLYILPKIIKKY